jgi:cobalt-zinc-cadmium efflux system outer membrane protein
MYNFLKLGRAAAFALIVQLTLSSLAGAPLRLTKEQAVVRALQYNPALGAARTTIDQATGYASQAGRWANPELSLDYATDRSFNDDGERSFGLGFEQRFPVTNRLRLQKDIAQDEIELARAEIANQVRLLSREVESSVASVAALQAQLKLREVIIELHQRFALFIESRIETGEASSIDANQIKIERYAVALEMQDLENQLLGELAALRQLIGAEVNTSIDLSHQFALPETEPELSILTRAALENHPEYRMKSLLYRIADKRISVAKAERWADVALRVFFEEERSVDAPGGLGTDRSFGIGVSIPLPLMNRNQGVIEVSRAQQRQVKYELDAVGLRVRSDANTQRERAISLYAQAREYDQSLTQLVAKNLADMNEAYSAGQISLAELFRSQEQGLKIQSTQLAKLHDFEQAMIHWKAATAQYTPVSR